MNRIIVLIFATLFVLISTNNVNAKQKSSSDIYWTVDRNNDTWTYKKSRLKPTLGPYMTDEKNSEAKDTFGWNETPHVFMRFDVDDLNKKKPLNLVFLWWHYHSKKHDKKYRLFQKDIDYLTDKKKELNLRQLKKQHIYIEFERITDFPESGHLDLWNSLDYWNTRKEVGEWRARTTWLNIGAGRGSRQTNFVVTPEPMSSILFIIGGATLLTHCYKRKKSTR